MSYPDELSEIILALINAKKTKHQIWQKLSQDSELKKNLEIDNEQIVSAIRDTFYIFNKYC